MKSRINRNPVRRAASLRRALFGLGLGLVVVTNSGCQTLTTNLASPTQWFKSKSVEEQHGLPQRMVTIWTDDVLTQIGSPMTRGFGARIYFYNADDKPVPVEGQLVVYAYDDSKAQEGAQRVPDRKFVFTPEEFKQHYSESQIGSSYSIWIPWDTIDGPRSEISLVPVFTSVTGKIVVGAQTVNVLHARSPQGDAKHNQVEVTKRTSYSSAIRPTTHVEGRETNEPGRGKPQFGNTANLQAPSPAHAPQEDPTGNSNPRRPGIRSTTIPVTGSLAETLRNAPPMPPAGQPLAPVGQPLAPVGQPLAPVGQQSPGNPSSPSGGTASLPLSSAPSSAPVMDLGANPAYPPRPGVHSEPPRFQAPASPSVPPGNAVPPMSPSPGGSPFLRPSRL